MRYVMARETFVKEAAENEQIHLKHVRTQDNQADGHTKRLDDQKFEDFFYGLGFVDG